MLRLSTGFGSASQTGTSIVLRLSGRGDMVVVGTLPSKGRDACGHSWSVASLEPPLWHSYLIDMSASVCLRKSMIDS